MLPPPLRSARSRELFIALLLSASLALGHRCPSSWPYTQTVEIADQRLRYWAVGEEVLEDGGIEVVFEAQLIGGRGWHGGHGRHGQRGQSDEIQVVVASQSDDVVVLDAALRFGPHTSPRPVARGRSGAGRDEHTPVRDRFEIRLAAGAEFDPAMLVFRGLDRFGGALEIASTATGRFRVEEIDGRHWLVTPEGHAFFSAGINHISVGGDFSPPLGFSPYRENVMALYGSEEGWAEVTEQRLRSWAVNTVAAWSSHEYFESSLPHTPILSLNRAAPAVPGWPTGQTGQAIRDYYDPAFESELALRVEAARPCAENPWCIGVFTDNELPWGRSVLQFGTYVDAYLSLPPGAPGKLALQAFLEARYGDIDAFNASWSLALASFDEIQTLGGVENDSGFCNEAGRRADRQAFVADVAARYYERVNAALRAAFPDLLILGSRLLAVYTAPAIYAAAAPYVDVISINDYDWDEQGRGLFKSEGEPYGYLFLDDPVSDLDSVFAATGRPIMISEWTVRTPTPDVDVLFPPFMPTAKTQRERADRYQGFMDELLARPFVVGSHWFKYHDQPATGRGDGENSLFGTVDIEDTPYAELSERMTAVNGGLYAQRLEAPLASLAGGGAGASSAVAAPLGRRTFSLSLPHNQRTGFFVFILPGTNLARAVSGGPLVLDAGAPDADGVAPLALIDDAVLAFETVVGDVACLRLQAEGSEGELACDGGFGHDAKVTQTTGAAAPPPLAELYLGDDSGPGAATLLVPLEFAQLPAGATPADCLTASYGPQWLAPLSTGFVRSTKGIRSFELAGENFVCGLDGAAWRAVDGAGMFAIGVPTFDGRVPGGDLATIFRIADRDEACRP